MDEHEGWSFLHPGIIDGVVAQMKRRRCWRRDGRALRRLNKHWCRHISEHIFELNPHLSRKVELRDAASLKKFPRLRRLNASSFFESSNEDADVFVMGEILQATQLSHLEINWRGLKALEAHDLSAMMHITSLNCREHCFFQWPKRLIKRLDLRTCAWCPKKLLETMKSLPRLKHLTATISWSSQGDFNSSTSRTLRGLESLSLCINLFPEISINVLSEVTSLVALELWTACHSDEFDVLKNLPLLKHLSVTIATTEDFLSESFSQVVTRLHSLTLSAPVDAELEFPRFTKKLENLRSLRLERLCLRDVKAMQDLSGLTQLSLRDIRCVAGLEFITELRHLKKLALEIPYSIQRGWFLLYEDYIVLNHDDLPELIDLTLTVRNYAPDCIPLVAELTRLESLCFDFPHYSIRTEDIVVLEKLKKLRELQIIGMEFLDEVDWNVHRELWIRLESIVFRARGRPPNAFLVFLSELETVTPHLMVQLKYPQEHGPFGTCLLLS